ncbi:hypothetical protein L249_7640 [Ophiocordyceps polyrhachis-furcata BCC 54312]|uniref:Uncharacterized protein n=1 Tax=Ophiocordyceps polyrhachis-furcata BCC 54312 TaxID=1330021 RepID=A0A367L9X3_9HYPO|nr:hypothetical protein L249_7640 [Ophiocordyceps polyrhachis-furcata BCC 54312]
MTEKQDLSAQFANIGSATVSDALDKLAIPGQLPDTIKPLTHYKTPTVGPAYTVRYVPASDPPGTTGDFIDDVAAGDVVVIDNDGRTDCTVWGDIMTQYAGLRGIAATVIHGACRDVDRALSDGYPVFSAGRYMRTGKDRVQVAETGGVVAVGGVRVDHGDIVVADGDGVVVVPRGRARDVLDVARAIEKSEQAIRDMIVDGLTSLAEARARLNYHSLQRRRERTTTATTATTTTTTTTSEEEKMEDRA